MRELAEMKAAGTSIMSKLKDTAKAQGVDPEFLIRKFAVERLAARINESRYADEYCFKGGMIVLRANPDMPRTTEDLDFTAFQPFDKAGITQAFREIAATATVLEDGFEFSLDENRVGKDAMVREDRENPGFRMYFDVRIHTVTRPATARIKVDAAYGETILPEPVYGPLTQTIKGWDPPVVPMYPWQTVLAEKIHTVAKQGRENIRLRDFYDIVAITRAVPVDGATLLEALLATYNRRGTIKLDANPVGFTPEFAALRQSDWSALMAKKVFKAKLPDFTAVVAEAAAFAHPLLTSACRGENFDVHWQPGEGWVSIIPQPGPSFA